MRWGVRFAVTGFFVQIGVSAFLTWVVVISLERELVQGRDITQ